jgi:superfamily II DNA helicase RecQ
VEHIRKNKAAILSANDIDNITRLFVYPKVAKAYINREVKVMDMDEKPGRVAETGALYRTAEDSQPVVREDKTRNGRKFIKITGEYQQAEEVRQRYLDSGFKAGLLNKDKTNEGEYYFFIDEEPPAEKELVKNQVAAAKEEVSVSKRKDREQLIKELKEFRLMKAREEKIAAYMIFNNEEMEALTAAYPVNEEELLKVKGFGKKKVEKYGDGILRVFSL